MALLNDKLSRIINKLTNRTGLLNIVPGSKIYQLAEAVASELAELELLLDKDIEQNSIVKASGQDLDIINRDFFGIERRPEYKIPISASMKAIKFYVRAGTFGSINNGEDIILPEGVLIESDKVILRIGNQTTLSSSLSELYISAEIVTGDLDIIPVNSIKKHNFSNYAQSVANTLLVTNPISIISFIPQESDDNFRYRTANALKSFVKTNNEGIRNEIISIPRISNVEIVNSQNGAGTFTVYVQGVTPVTSDDLIDLVTLTLQDHIGPWVTYAVSKYNYIGLELDLTIQTKNSNLYIGNTEFISNINEIVTTFVNNFYGDELYLLDIAKLVESAYADILNVSFNKINVYTGLGINRSYKTIDLSRETNPKLIFSNIEKLIIEQIPTPLTLRVE